MTPKLKKTRLTVLTLLASSSLLFACTQKENEVSKTTTANTKVAEQTKEKIETTDKKIEKQSEMTTTEEKSEDTTEDSKVTEKTTVETDSYSPLSENNTLPEALIGTFSGTSKQATNVSVTFDAHGHVSSTADFDGTTREGQGRIIAISDLGNGYYAFNYQGDIEAIMPGISGLGGAGFVVVNGVKVEGNNLTVVSWTGATYDSIDYNNPTDFGFSLTKQ